MGRLRSRVAILAGALLLSPAARAAEITRVESSGEIDSPFGLSLQVRYERTDRRAKITREFGNNSAASGGRIEDEVELRYSETANRIVTRLAVGLWHDLELRAEIPYVLNQDPSWRYALVGGLPVPSTPEGSSIADNRLTPDGGTCATLPCPMFPVGQTLYAGGVGDLRIGLAWAVLVERKESWVPTWALSLDVTAPTAPRFDPAEGRFASSAAFFTSPHFASTTRASVGRKIWVYDLASSVSRRVGAVDAYFRVHAALPQRTNQTYSNCDHAAALAAIGQMTAVAAANCALPAWETNALAQPPSVWGVLFGAELVPYEDKTTNQRFALDLRVGADFVGRGRWYNELTPATGKLLANEPYLTARAALGLHLRASRYVALGLRAAFEHDWDHFVTGEGMGKNAVAQVPPGSPQQNPNFDFRYDLPGRRFRVVDATLLDVQVLGQLTF